MTNCQKILQIIPFFDVFFEIFLQIKKIFLTLQMILNVLCRCDLTRNPLRHTSKDSSRRAEEGNTN